MPTIYTKKGYALPESRYLYKRSNRDIYHCVRTKYDYSECVRYVDSALRMSSSLRNALKDFARDSKNPCIVSKLLLHALEFKMYCAKDHVNFISFRENKGLISFMPFGKTQETATDGRWLLKGRQTMKPAKFARSVLNPRLVKRLNDKHFNLFATKFKTFEESTESVLEPTTFQVAYTEKPDEWKFSTGSCMRNKPVVEFYSCFDCQPLIIKTKDNLISGRAILWNTVDLVNVITNEVVASAPFLDRIYSPPEFSELFIRHAEENDYIHRGVSGGIGRIYYKNTEFRDVYVRTTGKTVFTNKWIPYMDTFRYGSCDEKTLYSHCVELDQRFIMDRADGTFFDNGYKKGHVPTAYDGYQKPEDCIIWKARYYKMGGGDTAYCKDDGKCYHIHDPLVINIGNVYYKRDSELLAVDYYTGNLYRKDMMVTRYTTEGNQILVDKRYAHYYKDCPNKIDKVKTEYTFKPSLYHKTKSGEYFTNKYYSNISIDYMFKLEELTPSNRI